MPEQTPPPAPLEASGTHTEHEDDPWEINIGDHPQRSNSPGYVRSRKLMIAIYKTLWRSWLFSRPFAGKGN
jgi:hypothetical protein